MVGTTGLLAAAALAGCGGGAPNLRFAEQRVLAEYGLRLQQKTGSSDEAVRSVTCTATGPKRATCAATVEGAPVSGVIDVVVHLPGNDVLLWRADDQVGGHGTESVTSEAARLAAEREGAASDAGAGVASVR
ncbi:hypothetical protein AB0L40_11735 [Patulibacter sp. NPDC049589]|uniref:hypothetical protein n=1 Tax=Patulibacter sp. NPDC049589 TaxID=3154731 RepID=UPI0034285D3B